MNKEAKSLIVLFLAFLLGSCFNVFLAQAQSNGTNLKIIKKCDIQYPGESCIVELELTNNTGKVLDGEAFLHVDYQGVCGDGFFNGGGIEAQFSIDGDNWLNFSGWEDGTTTVSGFKIINGKTYPKLKIETASNLCPGEYTFSLTLKGTTETGEEYVSPPVVIGGGGGVFIAGLIVSSESAASIKTDTVTITWQTNKFATSRVVYDTISHSILGNPPNYGYAFSTPEQDKEPKVTFHSIRIDGLTPGATYFYRTVSRASPEKVSQEHSFTTKGVRGAETEKRKEEEEEIPEGGVTPEVKGEETTGEGVSPAEEGIGEEEEEKKEGKAPIVGMPQRGLASMIASIGTAWKGISKSTFLTIIVILCLIGLVLIGVREWRLFRKKRKNNK